MIGKRVLFVSLALACTPALAGCFFFGNNGTGATGAGSNGTDPTEQNIAQYEQLQADLEKNRHEFLPAAMDIQGLGNRLFWLDYTYYDPTLWSYDSETDQKTHYGFGVGTGEAPNWRASKKIIATSELAGDKVILHAYDPTQKNVELGSLAMAAPGGGVKWNAYAPEGDSVYYVDQQDIHATTLYRWTVGQASAVKLLTLEEATGAQLGEFWDFIVDGNIMVFIEAGRVWVLDLTTKKATWTHNETESQGGFTAPNGVMVSTAKGPFWYSYQTKQLRDVAAAIKASGWQLNSTYATLHEYEDDLALRGDVFGYIGNGGLFSFDLASGEVRPMLLDARDNSVTYRYPVFLDDGSVFVKGLLSESGSIGADGPIYRVDWQF